jgi:hypothetical protein
MKNYERNMQDLANPLKDQTDELWALKKKRYKPKAWDHTQQNNSEKLPKS